MNTTLLRWILSPRTSWRVWRLTRATPDGVDFDTVWRATRIRLHPDEHEYRTAGHRAPPHGASDAPRRRPAPDGTTVDP
ncbi:hypothetical protein ACFC6L_29985 [Kitasatospora phosalacinea]|uniref:hypothetical protein n=1 Tax=Kitasatospora phosalacinea TaxID=2065 RepID=UPI0035DF4ABB